MCANQRIDGLAEKGLKENRLATRMNPPDHMTLTDKHHFNGYPIGAHRKRRCFYQSV
jgi:hypothetical protein